MASDEIKEKFGTYVKLTALTLEAISAAKAAETKKFDRIANKDKQKFI